MRTRKKANAIQKKIGSQKGASLILALLFFVMCSIIGSIILTAASVAAGRVKDLQKTSQEEYDLYSAAEYLKSVLMGENVSSKRFSGSMTIKTPGDILMNLAAGVYTSSCSSRINLSEPNSLVCDAWRTYGPGTPNNKNSLFVPILTRGNNYVSTDDVIENKLQAKAVYTISADADPVASLKLKIEGPAVGDVSAGTVIALFEMFENFDVRITLTHYNEQEKKEDDRKLYLWLYAGDVGVTVSKIDGTTKVGAAEISWPAAEITVTPNNKTAT